MQTNLSSDDFCSYNISALPFYYFFEPSQYKNTFASGEIGINAQGGGAGSYVRSDVIDISSFLSGREELLSRCNPPVPSLSEVKNEKLVYQNKNVRDLLPIYTREKKSSNDISSIDYNRWNDLFTNPQDLRFIIEDFSTSRIGTDTVNYSKLSWNPTKDTSPVVNKNECKNLLSPSRACGEYCQSVSGYNKKSTFENLKKPQTKNYPFVGPFSKNLYEVGGSSGGPNYFYGKKYNQGREPTIKQKVLTT